MAWTRREFIASGTGAALITQIEAAKAPLDSTTQSRLRAVMDEIIPKQDDMPSTSEAGGLAYFSTLRRTEPAFASQILAALEKVDQSSPTLDALRRLETGDPATFAILRDFVYEAYYTQPQIWKLIEYEFHATDHHGPRIKPFDEAIIANVRLKPEHYRKA